MECIEDAVVQSFKMYDFYEHLTLTICRSLLVRVFIMFFTYKGFKVLQFLRNFFF